MSDLDPLVLRYESLRFWATAITASALAGALYGLALDDDTAAGRGTVFGVCIGTLVILYERGIVLRGVRDALRRLPALPYFVAAEAMLLLLVLAAMVIGGAVCWLLGLGNETLLQSVTPSGTGVVYSLCISAAFIFVLRMRDLLGAQIFANLMLGRYHRPVSEERVFLFLDLVGSTTYAEEHGDLAAQELLKAVFAEVAEPVRRFRGQVDDYIGDQVIVSWPFALGVDQARCVACVGAVRDAIARQRERWISRFGLIPELRAALHGGSVVTAEVGVDRHKIAYFGDVMNATSRLEGLCRETGRAFLISEALLIRLPALPKDIAAEPIGEHRLRGRSGSMVVHALVDMRQQVTVQDRSPAVVAMSDATVSVVDS